MRAGSIYESLNTRNDRVPVFISLDDVDERGVSLFIYVLMKLGLNAAEQPMLCFVECDHAMRNMCGRCLSDDPMIGVIEVPQEIQHHVTEQVHRAS